MHIGSSFTYLLLDSSKWALNSIHQYLYFTEAETKCRHLAADIFKCMLLNEKDVIPIQISPKFVLRGSVDNKLALVHCWTGDKPLPEQWWHSSTTYVWVTGPQWVELSFLHDFYFAEPFPVFFSSKLVSPTCFLDFSPHKATCNVRSDFPCSIGTTPAQHRPAKAGPQGSCTGVRVLHDYSNIQV